MLNRSWGVWVVCGIPLERMREQKVLIVLQHLSQDGMLHASLHKVLGIHSPKSQRVYALTFLRPIYPRCRVRPTLKSRYSVLSL